jgi:hypothetical protein
MAPPTSVKSDKNSRTNPAPIRPKPTIDSMVVVVSVVVLDAREAPNPVAAVEAEEVEPEVIWLTSELDGSSRTSPPRMRRTLMTTNRRKSITLCAPSSGYSAFPEWFPNP